MSEEYMDIQVYSDDNKEQYVKFGDLLELIERLKIKKEKQDKEIERLNNIIKEAKEYIYENAYDSERQNCIDDLWGEIPKLLEILDKGE